MKKYKDKDGNYLDVYFSGIRIHLGWYCPDDDMVGALLGESDDEESRVAIGAILEHLEEDGERPLWDPKARVVLEFESTQQARKALRVANEALLAHAEGKPLPEWARTAIANGWKRPRGWRP